MGNLVVVPGSHRLRIVVYGLDPPDPDVDAVDPSADDGDAVVFDWRRWRSAKMNRSLTTHVFLTLVLGRLAPSEIEDARRIRDQ